jgi:glutathione-regulated potassium-efflux system ancillary protein KefG
MPARRVLVLLAHPMLERSRVNRVLATTAEKVPGVFVHDLYEAYPSMDLDVKREQQLLTEHDVVVFQHPFYWYSTPAILKEWQDLVLEHNWAYGSKGHHLEGKITLNVVSTGGPEQVYQTGGYNLYTVKQLLAPYELTARLCKMQFLAPFVVHSAFKYERPDELAHHIDEYKLLLEALRDDTLDLEKAASVTRLNAELKSLTKKKGGDA